MKWLFDWLRDRTPAPPPDVEAQDRLAAAALEAAPGSFGPSPQFFVGGKRSRSRRQDPRLRLAIRSANDNDARRALRRMNKGGLRPIRSAARPFEQEWRRESRVLAGPPSAPRRREVPKPAAFDGERKVDVGGMFG